MPTRITFCITELDPGGAERAMVRLVAGLDRAEWEPLVVCLQGRGPLVDDMERLGVPSECLGLRRSWQTLGVLRRLTAILRGFRPQILQTWLWHANILGRLAGWRAGVPHIFGGIRVADRSHPWRLRIDRWTAGLVERQVCVSRGVAEFSEREGGLDPESLTVIPNGVDVHRFANAASADLSAFGIPPLSPTVAWIGRLDSQKDPLAFVDLGRRLSQVYQDLQFLMVGDGPMRSEVERQIASDGTQRRIHLAGRQVDIAGILRASWCFVSTSRWEGMANVLLEAMAAGLPVVATDVEGVREVVTPHRTGMVVPIADPEALAAALALLKSDPESASSFGMSAQHEARERFPWDRFVESHVMLYRDAISPSSPDNPS